jgi:transcriptional regulator with XRE-family HTH domain
VPDDPDLEIGQIILGNHLRQARIDAGLNLPEAEQRTGLTRAALSDWERGRRLPSLPALQTMAKAYGVLVTDLLDGVYPFGARRAPRTPPQPPRDGRRKP